jgi:hypothetical protein
VDPLLHAKEIPLWLRATVALLSPAQVSSVQVRTKVGSSSGTTTIEADTVHPAAVVTVTE